MKVFKKILKIIAILVVLAFIVMQFFRIDTINPPVDETQTLEATVTVPDDVRQIMATSCNDCHSNNTRYPWYSQIAPASWFMKDHIDSGRSHLNFSIFKTYTPKKMANRFDGICEEVDTKEMPLPSYLWIHRDAVLNDLQIKTLCDWSRAEKEKIKVE